MPTYDLIIRNGMVVMSTAVIKADIAVSDERIIALAATVDGTSAAEIDAQGLHIFPGVIDAHAHCNEPGRTEWEGFATGTRAMAAGGTTAFFDMPLNAHPPTTDAASFDLKLAAARASSMVDFGLWGGLVPGNVEQLPELAARGVIGFKAFMSNSGIDDFAAVDDLTLHEGMACAAELGLIVAVHAENDQITSGLSARAIAAQHTDVRDYLNSRPAIAEREAIERAIMFAEATGCALHVVHVSTGRGVALVAEARARGVNVSCETCPHYLVLCEDDMERLGAIAKCAPPLRPQAEQDALWHALADGTLPMVASDHSPAPASMKHDSNFFAVWGGISGCQSLLPLMLTHGYHAHNLALPLLAQATAAYVAQRWNVQGKGRIETGYDADLVLLNLDASTVLQADALHYRHRHSPYVGMSMRGNIVRTLVRGTTVFADGKIVGQPAGHLIAPTRTNH